MTMTAVSSLKRRWMRDPEFKKTYDESAPAYEMAQAFIEARVRAKLTQAQVAKRMGTKQSVVSRMESGRHMPAMSSVIAYAKATGSRAQITLVAEKAPRATKSAGLTTGIGRRG
jgi:transcriptional regulator with XRE-family HTH domain